MHINTQQQICYASAICLGLLYSYLAGHVGREGDVGAFRALTRGYKHWPSRQLEQLEINVNHPKFCHVRCSRKASMKKDIYKVYLLLGRDGELANISTATCECAAGYVISIKEMQNHW